MDIEKELDKIAEGFIYTIDYSIWKAFSAHWHFCELDDETYLRYAKDAAQLVGRIPYNVPGNEMIKFLMSEYEALLKKYGFTDDIIPQAVYCMFQEYLGGWMTVIHQRSVDEGGPENVPELPEGDIDNYTLAGIFADLPPQPEVAAYLAEIGVDYNYEHFHMVTWFSDQMTHGIRYGFQRKHNFSARMTYNHLLNPCSLMWIAAVLGEDPEVVKKAATEAGQVKTSAEKSRIIRSVVPFERIYELALSLQAMEAAEWLNDDI